ncbi:MFS general substrate transporter [Meira miltonrushii]|uniref:MFS general substrate transporter n=1 Tax=Meira miltonrushii TaxID=1280837 RepID=A0A316VMU7_9BASI|nr:MFS general substrate transporter [Meira miltonrushii]PWN38624.1 MFS general substrate transporter [Meira miltonrushii]
MDDLSQYTNRKLPWSPRTTDFNEIAAHPYKGEGTKGSPFQVVWLPNDAENPLNMSEIEKWTLAAFVSIATLAVALASSAYSGAVRSIKMELGGSSTVITLGVSLFVLGFALGPLIWAPLSELLGRRNLFLFTYAFLTLWNSVAAASQTLAQLLVFRFLAGAFGSSPLANAGGSIADVFTAKERGLAMALFASAPFLGPALGPITGGFLGESAGFRWVQGFLGIFSGVVLFLGIFMYRETYAPLLLRRRAKKLSKATGKHYISQLDAGKGDETFLKQFMVSLGRPWLLLAYEPIVLLLSLYTAVVYAILYSFFSAFPIVFQEVRGWSPGIGGLAFLGILVGMIFAFAFVIFYINPDYIKEVEKNGGFFAPPEVRLKGALVGAPLLVLGLALFAATDFPSIHWSVPIILSSPFGFAMVLIFLSLQNYLIDAYLLYAASVLAANSVIRSLLGAAFPLFTPFMYNPGGIGVVKYGIHIGPAIGGGIALLFLPAPFLFYKRGAAIRKKCKYAAEADKLLQRMLNAGKEQESKESAVQQEQQTDEAIMQDDDVEQADDRIQRHASRSNRRQASGTGYADGDQLSMQYSHHSVY